MRKLVILAALAMAVLVVPGENQAQASHVACGDTLTANTKLDSDLTCATAPGLTIGADGITLNCAGHTITGPGSGGGIVLVGRRNVTVKNCHVTEFIISLVSSSHNTLMNNVAGGAFQGFSLVSSSHNTLTNNVARGAGLGFDIRSSNNNMLLRNTAMGNGSGLTGYVLGDGGSGNRFMMNTATGNRNYGFAIFSDPGNMFVKNTATGNSFLDCIDITSGSGTAGTANTWIQNTGNTSSPPGICKP